ncbi:MAG: phosphotransferase [Candidatus Cloacimonadia bacterium]
MKSELTVSPDKKSIVKKCRCRKEFENELRVYRLNLDFTPRLLSHNEETLEIEMSYIDGAHLWGVNSIDFIALGDLFGKFHSSYKEGEMVLSHRDTNPRNYLYDISSKKYYFIDFAESGLSFPENDLVCFLLFWGANCHPSEFDHIMVGFLRGYHNYIEMLDEDRTSLFREWFDDFDERRRVYGKTPCLNQDWQERNRAKLLDEFYQLLR